LYTVGVPVVFAGLTDFDVGAEFAGHAVAEVMLEWCSGSVTGVLKWYDLKRSYGSLVDAKHHCNTAVTTL
jgi:hypothetical protein